MDPEIMNNPLDPKVEICLECDYIREYAPDGERTGQYLCVHPKRFCNSVALNQRACFRAVPTTKPPKQKQYYGQTN